MAGMLDDMSQPAQPTAAPSDLLTYAEAAEMLRVPSGTMYHLVHERRVPHVRLGPRSVRFRRRDLEAWIAEHTVAPEDRG